MNQKLSKIQQKFSPKFNQNSTQNWLQFHQKNESKIEQNSTQFQPISSQRCHWLPGRCAVFVLTVESRQTARRRLDLDKHNGNPPEYANSGGYLHPRRRRGGGACDIGQLVGH